MSEGLEVEVVRARLDDFPDLSRFRAVLNGTSGRAPRPTGSLSRATSSPSRGACCASSSADASALTRGTVSMPPLREARPAAPRSVAARLALQRLAYRPARGHRPRQGADVGIDIERLDCDVKPLDIAKRYFTPRELEALRSAPEDARAKSFLAGWTRKEAIVKARGLTMAEGLTTLSVDLDPGHSSFARGRARSARAAPVGRLTAFLLPDRNLIGALALCSEQEARLRWDALSSARFD